MKKLFLTCFILTITLPLWSQLRVVNSGRVQVENNMYVTPSVVSDTAPAVTITATAPFTKSAFGIYSKSWYQKNPAGTGSAYNFGNKVFGIYGCTEDNLISSGQYITTPPFNAGVVGTSDYGIGIYGSIGNTFPIKNPGQFAGYFNGNTKVVGTLTCTSLAQTSDLSTKNNIQYLQTNTLNQIMQLQPISFYYNTTEQLFGATNHQSSAARQMHYGFVAQDIKEVLPNIVYTEQDSILSINYIELIPLLVKTIQELSTEVEQLKMIIQSESAK